MFVSNISSVDVGAGCGNNRMLGVVRCKKNTKGPTWPDTYSCWLESDQVRVEGGRATHTVNLLSCGEHWHRCSNQKLPLPGSSAISRQKTAVNQAGPSGHATENHTHTNTHPHTSLMTQPLWSYHSWSPTKNHKERIRASHKGIRMIGLALSVSLFLFTLTTVYFNCR